jgi:hypothetical protein
MGSLGFTPGAGLYQCRNRPSLPAKSARGGNAHKLALLNHLIRGRQLASWNWCPQHQAGLDLFMRLAYPVEFTYHSLLGYPFPQLKPYVHTSSDPSADPTGALSHHRVV